MWSGRGGRRRGVGSVSRGGRKERGRGSGSGERKGDRNGEGVGVGVGSMSAGRCIGRIRGPCLELRSRAWE